MAKEKKPKRNREVPSDRPVFWGDLDKPGREVVNARMAHWGRAADRAGEVRKKYEAKLAKPASKDTETRSRRALMSLDAIEGDIKNRNVTIETAARSRVNMLKQGVERAKSDARTGQGTGDVVRDAGFGWYYEHRRELDEITRRHGITSEHETVIASASMSPQNSPSNEKAAVDALLGMQRQNPTVTDARGNTAQFGDIPTSQAARLSAAGTRKDVTIHGADNSQEILTQMGRGGTFENTEQALGIIRGERPAEMKAHGQAKIHSYASNIAASEARTPSTDEQNEYRSRAEMVATGQGVFDIWGKRQSNEGMLAKRRPTAEDTWMNAISSGQPMRSATPGTRTSPAKFVGSDKEMTAIGKVHEGVSAHPNPAVGQEELRHAWNNQATVRAAAMLTSEIRVKGDQNWDFHVPANMLQEVPWTEARRQAGKDPEYKRQIEASQTERSRTPVSGSQFQQIPGQLSFDI